MVALTVLDAEKFLLDKREGPAIQVAVEEDRSARPLKADKSDLEIDMIKLIILPSILMLLLGSWVVSSRRSILEISAKHSRDGRTRLSEREPRMAVCASRWREYSQSVSISIASPKLPESRHKMLSNESGWHLRSYLVPKSMLMGGSLCCQKSNRRCCCTNCLFTLSATSMSFQEAHHATT